MLVDIKDWPKMSKAYKSFFDRKNLPSRSAFAGSGLALGAKIEIECLAKAKQKIDIFFIILFKNNILKQ